MSSSNVSSHRLDDTWFALTQKLRPPQKRDCDARRFCDLVESAAYTKDKRVITHLFELLTDIDTGGIQQSVYGVLGTTDVQDYYSALFEIMPSLIKRAPNAASQCLDFPGRDLSTEEIRKILSMAQLILPRSTITILISTMRENGMSESENHEVFFNYFVKYVEQFHGN